MGRDLRGSKKNQELLEYLGDVQNPTSDQFVKIFARFKDKQPEFYADDYITIGPENSKFVKPNSTTTVGVYIFNKFVIEPLEVFGYINHPIPVSTWEELENSIAKALSAYDITPQQVGEFIDRAQFLLGGPLAQIISPSVSHDIMTLPPKATKLRDKLIAENQEKLAENDPLTSSKIEREVVDLALKEMENNHSTGKEFFDSGAIDPYNNYRTMMVMKGAIKDNTGESPTGYKVITSNYNTGISKEDMPKIADSLVTSSYMSGIATADSGTLGKKYNVIGQRIKIGDPGSDCGTKVYLKTKITDRHLYRYIVENGKLIMLDHDNIDKYKGKVCNLRSPIHCKFPDPTYCSKCVGERPYRVGNYNLGLSFMIISGSTMNAALKTKHDVTVKYKKITIDDLTKYVK